MRNLAGHWASPPALLDCSPRRKDDAERKQEHQMAEYVDPELLARLQIADQYIDADVLVDQQCPWCAEQEHRAEQHPLHFEPGIRRCVDQLPHHGVA
jgi:hypothetical protein